MFLISCVRSVSNNKPLDFFFICQYLWVQSHDQLISYCQEHFLLNIFYFPSNLRFHTLSQCFGQNTPAFQLATAFVLSRILRNATSPGDVWSKSSYSKFVIIV